MASAATTQVGDQGPTIGRTAALLAGLPTSVPGYAIDRTYAGAMTAVIPGGAPSLPAWERTPRTGPGAQLGPVRRLTLSLRR